MGAVGGMQALLRRAGGEVQSCFWRDPVRKNPRDERFVEFLLVEDANKLSSQQKRVVETARKTKLNSKDLKALAQGIMADHDDRMLEDIFHTRESTGDVSLKELLSAQSGDESESGSDDVTDDELAKAIAGDAGDKKGRKPSKSWTRKQTPSRPGSRNSATSARKRPWTLLWPSARRCTT